MKDQYTTTINGTVPLFRSLVVNATLQDAWNAIAKLREIAAGAPSLVGLSNWFWKQRYYAWSDCKVRQQASTGHSNCSFAYSLGVPSCLSRLLLLGACTPTAPPARCVAVPHGPAPAAVPQVTSAKIPWSGTDDPQCTPCYPGPDMDHPVLNLDKSLCEQTKGQGCAVPLVRQLLWQAGCRQRSSSLGAWAALHACLCGPFTPLPACLQARRTPPNAAPLRSGCPSRAAPWAAAPAPAPASTAPLALAATRAASPVSQPAVGGL